MGRTLARWHSADPFRPLGGGRVVNTNHLIHGRTYRICVYRTADGYSSFAESPTRYLGATGEHRSADTARLCALCLARADAAAHRSDYEEVA